MPVSPATGDFVVARPRLEGLLNGATSRRLTALTGGAGIGKTTLLFSWSSNARTTWHTITAADTSLSTIARTMHNKLRLRVPALSSELLLAIESQPGPVSMTGEADRAATLAGTLAEDLDRVAGDDIILILDNLQLLSPNADASRFVAELARNAPHSLHIITASRDPLPFPISRMKLHGDAIEIDQSDLAFTRDEVEALFELVGREVSSDFIDAVMRRTGGWPVAVALTARTGVLGTDNLNPDDATWKRTLFDYLAEEVINHESPEMVDVLRRVANLPWIVRDLAEYLGFDMVDRLLGSELRPVFTAELDTPPRAVTITPLLTEYFTSRLPLPKSELVPFKSRAAQWYQQVGAFPEALDCLLAAEAAPEVLGSFVLTNGDAMLAGETVTTVLEAIQAIPGDNRTPELALIEANALQMTGDWEGAIAAYRSLIIGDDPIPAGLAWRLGYLLHMKGDVAAALELYERAATEYADASDQAALLSWHAAALWLRGDRDASTKLASEALGIATRIGDHRSLATTYTVMAMNAAFDGDRASNDFYYLQALDHAERARDAIQTIRIRSNRGSHFFEEGDYQTALAELDIALRLADLTGSEFWKAMALTNRGQVVFALGRIEEALQDLGAAREAMRRLGSRIEAYPLSYLGTVHAMRGDRGAAIRAYEEAVRLSEDQGDLQGLVPSLAGLARVTATDDPARARTLADRACETTSVLGHVEALLASAHVASVEGDHARAMEDATRAGVTATKRNDLPGIAESLELRARASADSQECRRFLREARDLWDQLAAPIGVTRVDIALARHIGGDEGLKLARHARTMASRLGAGSLVREATEVASSLSEQVPSGVVVTTLGHFSVSVAGRVVSPSDWQSRVAREVFAMLVTARGRAVHREVLMERMWPDESPKKTSNRLSVALSTIRGVLDPTRTNDSNHYVATHEGAVLINMDNLQVDVVDFLAAANDGLTRIGGPVREAAGHEAAIERLKAAELLYLGDYLPEYQYADWTINLREEARTAYVAAVTALAKIDFEEGEYDSSARRYLRILEQEPYNEIAHRGAIDATFRAGRHGVARRLYRVYAEQMATIGVEPSSYPSAEKGETETSL
ncbi:MAG: tetratricopeptide repeat protein [Acidimicrobiia bacterium]|nr:tetratricopeptide repeat protein [Acidimicrobiia bacterium]